MYQIIANLAFAIGSTTYLYIPKEFKYGWYVTVFFEELSLAILTYTLCHIANMQLKYQVAEKRVSVYTLSSMQSLNLSDKNLDSEVSFQVDENKYIENSQAVFVQSFQSSDDDIINKHVFIEGRPAQQFKSCEVNIYRSLLN